MIASLLPVASKLLGKFIEDKDTKNKLAHEIATMAEKHAQALAMEQIKVNIEEAKGNWFQSSWRPLIGWICGLSLAINYMVSPILAGFGIIIPQADMSLMMSLLFNFICFLHNDSELFLEKGIATNKKKEL